MAAAAAVPRAVSLAAASPVCCPACGEHFRKPPSRSVPMTLACHHNICHNCFEAMELAAPDGTPAKCPLCSGVIGAGSVNRGLAAYADEVYHALRAAAGGELEPEPEEMDVPPVAALPLSQCREHPDDKLEYFCMKEMKALCGKCVAASHTGDGHDVKHMDADGPFLREKLRELVGRARETAKMLQTKSARIAAAKEAMVRRAARSGEEFQASVAKLRAALVERRDKLIAEAQEACAVHRKILADHAAELGQASTNVRDAVATAEAARASGSPAEIAAALDKSTRVKKAVAGVEPMPRAPTVVDIVVNKQAIMDAISKCLRVRQLRVDGDGFVVTGSGLERYIPGDSAEAQANNVVNVAIKGVGGAPVEDLFGADVGITLTAPSGDGATIGVPVTVVGKVMSAGHIQATYTVDATVSGPLSLRVLAFGEPIDVLGPWTISRA